MTTRKKATGSLFSVLAAAVMLVGTAGVASADTTDVRSPDINGYHTHGNVKVLRFESSGELRGARVQAYTRFERAGSNSGVDAKPNEVFCRDSLGRTDSDREGSATKTTVTFTTSPAPRGSTITVTCDHKSTYQGIVHAATTTIQITLPIF
jgi:hypothetical protein